MMAFLLTIMQLVRYARVRATYPTGLKIAGIPVGGLSNASASERLVKVYQAPIEVKYNGERIQVRPASLGFELHINNMLALADQQRTGDNFWAGFWKFLWNIPLSSSDIPLQAHYDEKRIQSLLEHEVASRYDEPSLPPIPIPGESEFYPAKNGTEIDYPTSITRIKEALASPNKRSVNLEIRATRAVRPGIDQLEKMLHGIIQESGFDGLVEFYLKDLQNGLVLHFTDNHMNENVLPNDIAFSAWSTIKIPVLVSAFARLEEPYNATILQEIEEMVEVSSNESTDAVAKQVIEKNLAPLEVSADMQTLGLQNTFWGGFFSLGSPLLRDFKTAANQRTDINTDPDRYGQSTSLDMGLLMEDLYYCGKEYGGAFPLAFEGRINQAECQRMLDYLNKNKIGVLLQAGMPAGTRFAHKHGWANEVQDGYIHTMADVGAAYTPGGDYVLSVFIYHPVQIVFDPANLLFSKMGAAVYNYYNLE